MVHKGTHKQPNSDRSCAKFNKHTTTSFIVGNQSASSSPTIQKIHQFKMLFCDHCMQKPVHRKRFTGVHLTNVVLDLVKVYTLLLAPLVLASSFQRQQIAASAKVGLANSAADLRPAAGYYLNQVIVSGASRACFYCPIPVLSISTEKTEKTRSVAPYPGLKEVTAKETFRCKDKNQNCPSFAKLCNATLYELFLRLNCPDSCGVCGGGGGKNETVALAAKSGPFGFVQSGNSNNGSTKGPSPKLTHAAANFTSLKLVNEDDLLIGDGGDYESEEDDDDDEDDENGRNALKKKQKKTLSTTNTATTATTRGWATVELSIVKCGGTNSPTNKEKLRAKMKQKTKKRLAVTAKYSRKRVRKIKKSKVARTTFTTKATKTTDKKSANFTLTRIPTTPTLLAHTTTSTSLPCAQQLSETTSSATTKTTTMNSATTTTTPKTLLTSAAKTSTTFSTQTTKTVSIDEKEETVTEKAPTIPPRSAAPAHNSRNKPVIHYGHLPTQQPSSSSKAVDEQKRHWMKTVKTHKHGQKASSPHLIHTPTTAAATKRTTSSSPNIRPNVASMTSTTPSTTTTTGDDIPRNSGAAFSSCLPPNATAIEGENESRRTTKEQGGPLLLITPPTPPAGGNSTAVSKEVECEDIGESCDKMRDLCDKPEHRMIMTSFCTKTCNLCDQLLSGDKKKEDMIVIDDNQ